MTTIEKSLCIHGHFYQPPRQDALTGLIPQEPGAYPYQNWNEKIHAECYRPNAEQRNFERISFNMGPTLMQWMEQYDPETYRQIIQQERSTYQLNGIGNGMAQAYNHTILPLASRQDKITQIMWGMSDFQHRFGHAPAGMWLPEAAVDMESLRIMSDLGIRYTILAPWQAAETELDPCQPYRIDLGHHRSIVVFFYQMDLSTRISFDPASTTNADQFLSDYVCGVFSQNGSGLNRPLVMIASDGELYGHHQPYREKFLSRLVDGASEQQRIKITYPGLFLNGMKKLAPIKIRDLTSWSCHHGVERWRGECSCTPGATWKAPMRKALDRTAFVLDKAYLDFCRPFNVDAWGMRHQYMQVSLGDLSWKSFTEDNFPDGISEENQEKIRTILDVQITRQWMFTSCGWFFEDFDRIEPRNNIAYAAQAVSRMERITGKEFIEQLLPDYALIKSNRTELSGDDVFLEKYHQAVNHDAEFLNYLV